MACQLLDLKLYETCYFFATDLQHHKTVNTLVFILASICICGCCDNLPANGFHLDAFYGVYFILYHEVLILTALDYGKQWVLAAVVNVLSISYRPANNASLFDGVHLLASYTLLLKRLFQRVRKSIPSVKEIPLETTPKVITTLVELCKTLLESVKHD